MGRRGRNFNSETKPLRRVSTLSPSPALTPQPSTCSQSMSAELTQELMVIGRSCMRAELRSSEQKCLKHPGRKSLQNGARGQRQDCQNWFGERPGKKAGDPETPEGEEDAGAEAGEAEEDYDEEEKRRRRKKKRNKKFLTDMWQTSTSHRRNYKHSIRVIASIPSRALVSWFSPFCCYCYHHDQTGQ